MICSCPKVLNFKQLFCKVRWFICNSRAVLRVCCTKFNTLQNSSYTFELDMMYINMWANAVSKGVSKVCQSKLLYPDNVASCCSNALNVFVSSSMMASKMQTSCTGSMYEKQKWEIKKEKTQSTKCQEDEDNISPHNSWQSSPAFQTHNVCNKQVACQKEVTPQLMNTYTQQDIHNSEGIAVKSKKFNQKHGISPLQEIWTIYWPF